MGSKMISRRSIWLVTLAATAISCGAFAKTAPKPNYIYSEGGVYYYPAAITRQQREAGQVTGDAVGYRFYGKNESGEYVLARVSGDGSVSEFIYCKNPCRVIRTGSGSRFINNGRVLVGSAFADAVRGKLRNTNPEALKLRSRPTWSIPSRSPLDANDISQGATNALGGVSIRSSANALVFATADGVVEFAGSMEGYGTAIRLDHGAEIQTVYGNLGTISVSLKSKVSKGQAIGTVAVPPKGSEPELIYEVRIAGKAVNPMPYIGRGGDAEFNALFRSWQSVKQTP